MAKNLNINLLTNFANTTINEHNLSTIRKNYYYFKTDPLAP